jgi:phosphate transport system ATP-binding protein
MYSLYPGTAPIGEIMLDGQNILAPGVDLNMLRAKVGMVFQKPTPFPMSIHDNIAFGVRLYETCRRARWTSASNGRSPRPRCGTRRRTS